MLGGLVVLRAGRPHVVERSVECGKEFIPLLQYGWVTSQAQLHVGLRHLREDLPVHVGELGRPL
ncbi:hypothetical protein BKI49_09875 [Streptomyces sp. Tue6028]|nr:hypothetical protein BKI49_09875 [Streptomyces sp. Tue6028]